jgi:hypothetical protein
MAEPKTTQLVSQSVYQDHVEFKQFVDQFISSYDRPVGVIGEFVLQMAECSWWLKSYHRDKDHLILMKMASLLVGQDKYYDKESMALNNFDLLHKYISGHKLSDANHAELNDKLGKSNATISSLRAAAIDQLLPKLEVIDRLIERQVKNIRALHQSLESLRFAPLLYKKMSLEIQALENEVLNSIENNSGEIVSK